MYLFLGNEIALRIVSLLNPFFSKKKLDGSFLQLNEENTEVIVCAANRFMTKLNSFQKEEEKPLFCHIWILINYYSPLTSINFKILILTFRVLRGQAPACSELLHPPVPGRLLGSCDHDLLAVHHKLEN